MAGWLRGGISFYRVDSPREGAPRRCSPPWVPPSAGGIMGRLQPPRKMPTSMGRSINIPRAGPINTPRPTLCASRQLTSTVGIRCRLADALRVGLPHWPAVPPPVLLHAGLGCLFPPLCRLGSPPGAPALFQIERQMVTCSSAQRQEQCMKQWAPQYLQDLWEERREAGLSPPLPHAVRWQAL